VEGVCNVCRSFVGMGVCGREKGNVGERERTCVSISGRITRGVSLLLSLPLASLVG